MVLKEEAAEPDRQATLRRERVSRDGRAGGRSGPPASRRRGFGEPAEIGREQLYPLRPRLDNTTRPPVPSSGDAGIRELRIIDKHRGRKRCRAPALRAFLPGRRP